MPDKPLSQRETAILLLLMAEAREITNPQLEEQFGLKIHKGEREHLHQLKLIDIGKKGRAFTHVLTDDGWARATEMFRKGIPKSSTLAARALEAVVRAMVSGLQRYVERADQSLADIFGREEDLIPAITEPVAGRTSAPEVCGDIETSIRKAYGELAEKPGVWVSLTRLRPLLGDASRDEVDGTLRRMIALPDVHIIPESNQKALTDHDRQAAVTIGDQAKHLLLIEA